MMFETDFEWLFHLWRIGIIAEGFLFVCLLFNVPLEFFYLFVCFFCPTRDFFTYLETSPLPVKDCEFSPMLGTRVHWAVRDIFIIAVQKQNNNTLKWCLFSIFRQLNLWRAGSEKNLICQSLPWWVSYLLSRWFLKSCR